MDRLRVHLSDLDGTELRLVEFGSGTGQHAAAIGEAMPDVMIQPTEYDPVSFPSIRAWTAELPNVLTPLEVDASTPRPSDPAAPWCGLLPHHFDVALAINVTHISPWPVTVGLVQGGARVLRPGGKLIFYGPFLVDGAPTTPSNAEFDASLRHRDASWGLRDIALVDAEARAVGLELLARDAMPANNFLLVWRKRGGDTAADDADEAFATDDC